MIGTLPFTDAVDNTTATTESGEPQFCYFSPKTIWYSFTANANAPVKADMAGSSFGDTILRVYQETGSGFGGLVIIGCSSYADSFSFNAQAGTTYYIVGKKLSRFILLRFPRVCVSLWQNAADETAAG